MEPPPGVVNPPTETPPRPLQREALPCGPSRIQVPAGNIDTVQLESALGAGQLTTTPTAPEFEVR